MITLLQNLRNFIVRISLNIAAITKGIFICIKFDDSRSIKTGFLDHRSQLGPRDAIHSNILKRIARSYNKAKFQQKDAPQPYQVGQMWQGIVNAEFQELLTCLQLEDISGLETILTNLHRKPCSGSAGGGYGDYHTLKKHPILYKYLFAYTWHKYYKTYKQINGNVSELSWPLVGNPVGLHHHGQIIPTDAFRHYYYAGEILSLLQDTDRPVVCEIGGGVGGLAYAVTSKATRNMQYILLDIPETLVLSSYFLMTALPDKNVLLYGEGSLDPANLNLYDIVLMPNFVLPKLGQQVIDLFFNSCSFSEMDSITVKEYIRRIETICKKHFMHINHNAKFIWYDRDGKKNVNLPANEIIPDPDQFRKIYQHSRKFFSIKDQVFYHDHKAQHFVFLYTRNTSSFEM